MGNYLAEGVIGLSLDSSSVDAGIAQTVASVSEMQTAFTRSGQRISKELDKVGDSGANAGAKIGGSTKNITSSIERTIATIQAGGRGTSQFYENIAKLRGADLNTIKPYIEKLKEAEKAADMAALANNRNAVSAKQMGFALRNVPAQISDIVVSLQGGQRPLTVFLQQGAQLKDLFGGTGNAIKALGGYLLGLINPFSLAAAAVTGLAAAYYLGSEQSDRLTKAIVVSGNAVGQSNSSLENLVQTTGSLTGNYSLARDAVEALTASGKLSGNVLNTALIGVVAGVELTGRAVDDLVKDFEALTANPTKAVGDLNEKYNFLTVDIYKQIEALQKQGKNQEAATLAIKTYADTLNARNNEILSNLGYIEKGWREIKDASNGAVNALLSVGRPLSDNEKSAKKLADAYKQLNSLQETIGGFDSKDRPLTRGSSKEIENKKEEIRQLIQLQAQKQAAAIKEGLFQQEQKNKIAAIDEIDKYSSGRGRLTKADKIKKEEEEFNRVTKNIDKNTDEYRRAVSARNQAIKEINEQGVTNRKSQIANESGKEYATLYGEFSKILDGTNELTKAEQTLRDIQNGRFSDLLPWQQQQLANLAQEVQRKQELAIFEQGDALAIEREIELSDELLKQEQDAIDVRQKGIIFQDSINEKLDEENKLLEFKLSIAGLSDQAQKEKLADYQVEIELKNTLNELADQGIGLTEEEITALREKIALNSKLGIQLEKTSSISNGLGSAFKDTFRSAVLDVKNLGDAFDMLGRKIEEVTLNKFVIKPFEDAIDSIDFGGIFSSVFGGGRASGGKTSAGKFYEVNENSPELITTGGKTFLMMGANDGYVTPSTKSQAGGSVAGSPVVNLTIIGAPSQPKVQSRDDGNGTLSLEVMFDAVKNNLSKDIRSQGPFSQVMENQFNLNRNGGAT